MDLALWCEQRKDLDRAITLLKEAKETYRAIRGATSQDYTDVLLRLGGIYYARSDLANAVPLYEEVCPLLKATKGADNVNYYSNIAWLGSVYRGRGDHVRALEMYHEALPLYEKHLGPRHKDTVGLLRMLAHTAFDLRRYNDAERIFGLLRIARKRRCRPTPSNISTRPDSWAMSRASAATFAKRPSCMKRRAAG